MGCLSVGALLRNWRDGSPVGNPEGNVEKALETGISFNRGPISGNLEEGSSTRDFEN